MTDELHSRLARIARDGRPRVLLVSHGWGGGVRRHVDELAAALAPRADVLRLTPAAADVVRLQGERDGERTELYFTMPGEFDLLAKTLRALGVSRIHVHHVDALPREVLDLPAAVDVPFDVTLHDAYPYCPRYHLDRGEGRYCGEPDEAGGGEREEEPQLLLVGPVARGGGERVDGREIERDAGVGGEQRERR